MRKRPCPECGGPTSAVMYCGLPMRLCDAEDCRCGWGLGDWLCLVFFNGRFIQYDGTLRGYLRALWFFLTGR